jgi:large subunit ribosomal protein L31
MQTRRSVAVCAKKGGGAEQPQWFEEAKVFCNGEEVMTVGGTQAEYVVDIWSGNHPFFQGRSSAIMTDAGQVSRFANRFGDLGDLSAVETMDTPAKEEDK